MSVKGMERGVEVKVGALVVFSALLLAGFVWVLGDFGFKDRTVFYVDYQSVSGLKPGAAVKQGGIRIGEVSEIKYLGGEPSPQTGEPIWARVEIAIDDAYLQGVRTTSDFIITAEGVLGEKFISIETLNPDAPPAQAEHIFRGIDPMGIEQVMQKVSRSLDAFNKLLNSSDLPVGDLLTHIDSLVVHTDQILVENRERLRSILAHVDTLARSSSEVIEENRAPLKSLISNADALAGDAREAVGDARLAIADVRSTLQRVDRVVAQVDENFGPVIQRIVRVSESIEAFAQKLLGIANEAEPRVLSILSDADLAMKDVKQSTGQVAELVNWVYEGKGTVGGLLRDEEIFDNMRELLRELKRRPWKIVWKE